MAEAPSTPILLHIKSSTSKLVLTLSAEDNATASASDRLLKLKIYCLHSGVGFNEVRELFHSGFSNLP